MWLLCIEGYEWRDVYGGFTDKKKLMEAYQLLQDNDARIKGTYIYGKIVVYELELNEFYGEVEDWQEEERYRCVAEQTWSVDIKDIMEGDDV